MDQDTKTPGILNLDEMLGGLSLKVRINDKEYPIRSAKSLTPQEFGKVMAYGKKFTTMTEDEFEKENGQVVMKAIDDLLEILAPSLPRYKPTLKERFSRGYVRKFALSLQETIAVVQFWSENNQPKNTTRAVAPTSKKRTRR